MGGGAEIFELFAGEDINSDKMDFCVAVFAGLGSAHLHDLAGARLDHHEPVLAQRRALHRVSGRSTCTKSISSPQ